MISNATRWDTFGNSNISSIGTFKRGKTSSFSFINLPFFLNVQENSWKKKNFQKRRKTFKRIMLRHHHSFQFIWVSKRQFCLLALTATILYLRYALCSLGMPYCWEFDISNIFFVWPVWVRNWQDNWNNLEKSYGSIFLSIPTVLDPSLAPEGHHILHVFTTAGIEDWEVRTVF